MSKRTSTSYTVLGLLALGPKTGNQIVQGYARSIGQIGSRSDAVLYEEPKRLVKDGLAAAEEERRGKRTVAVYSITELGLRELEGWLSQPSTFPILDAEPVVRAVFSDFGEQEDLRATIEELRDESVARLAVLADIGEEYLGRERFRAGTISVSGGLSITGRTPRPRRRSSTALRRTQRTQQLGPVWRTVRAVRIRVVCPR